MRKIFKILNKLAWNYHSRLWERVIEWTQKKCKHALFTYDSDTDVTYCDDCGKSLYCGDLMDEILGNDC